MAIHGRATPRTDRQKARILEVLEQKPMTMQQIADELHMTYGNAWNYVAALRKARQIRACDYLLSGCRPEAIYEIGSAPDAVYVRRDAPKGRYTRRPEALEKLATPLSANGLAEAMGVTNRQASAYLRFWRAAGLVRISHWRRTSGNQIPYYVSGTEPDEPRPSAYTPRQYRERVKAQKTRWAAALGV